MIDFLTACWFGVIGACVGSFLNVVAYRMPLGMSVIWKPSHCPKCKTQILARDNVPVLGWLWLKGKCRACSEPISPRYAFVEAVMGLTFFVLCYAEVFSGGANLPTGPLTEEKGAINVIAPHWGLIGQYAYECALLSLMMCILLVDVDGKSAQKGIGVILFPTLFVALVVRPINLHFTVAPLLLMIGLGCVAVAASIYGFDKRLNAFYSLLAMLMLFGGTYLLSVVIIVIVVSMALYSITPLRKLLNGRVITSGCYVGTICHSIFWNELSAYVASSPL